MPTPFRLHEQTLDGFVATSDAARAKRFYGETLGLPLVSEGPFALIFDVGTNRIWVQIVDTVCVADYTALGWHVPNITEAVKGLAAAGVKFEHYDGFDQDEFEIWTAPSGTQVAWFKDPDGNTLSVSQG